MEEARAFGELLKQGWRPSAPSSSARGTVRSRPVGFHRVGRSACRRIAQQGRGVHQQRWQRPRLSRGGGFPHTGEVRQRCGPRYHGSGDASLRFGSGCRRSASPSQPRRTARKRARGPICASALWARAPITPRSSITRASRRVNMGFGGEDGGGIYHSVYDDFYWYTHFADTDFVYGTGAGATGRHQRACAWRTPNSCPSISGLHRNGQALHRRGPEAGEGRAGSDRRAQPPARRRRLRRHQRPASTSWLPPQRRRFPRSSTLRRWKTGWRRCSAPRAYDKALATAAANGGAALAQASLREAQREIDRGGARAHAQRRLPNRPGSSTRSMRPASIPDMA